MVMLELDAELEEQVQWVELARHGGFDTEDNAEEWAEEWAGVVAAGELAVREQDWRTRVE